MDKKISSQYCFFVNQTLVNKQNSGKETFVCNHCKLPGGEGKRGLEILLSSGVSPPLFKAL